MDTNGYIAVDEKSSRTSTFQTILHTKKPPI